MKFTETALKGCYVVDLEKVTDMRGFFARAYSADAFRDRGLDPDLTLCNVGFNLRQGTVRGMHYQLPPHTETKLVRCTRGSIYDVAIDLRPESPTHRKHFGLELTAETHRALYIPKGFAHGFQTLEPNTEVLYMMSDLYSPDHARGVRWNDPVFAISWPFAEPIINERDRNFPDFTG